MSKFKYKYFYLITIFIVLLTVLSCSTKKNTWTRRFYHNISSKYNGYFNGKESLKQGVAELLKLHKDDYTKVLSIYKYGSKEDAATVAPKMDRAIEKASVVIKKHSMDIRGKEYCNWIDDSWLLVGKAYFYKQDYKLAAQTFDFVLKQYKKNPIKYDALIWLIKTYNKLEKFNESELLLDQLENEIEKYDKSKTSITKIKDKFKNKGISNKVIKEFPLSYADFYIQQEKYAPAIEYLLTGIDINKKKKIRTRLTFILAQVYQKNGDLSKAYRKYKKVVKMNPVYEMAFASKINMAMCYDFRPKTSKQIKSTLLKMLKDEKNKEYLDQIYYALAKISLKEKDTTSTIKYLKLSSNSSVSNNYQKFTSLLKLADIYFIKREYEPAQIYYDSTIIFLPKDYPQHNAIISKNISLNKLVKNLKIIELEDSLQTLAKMSIKERNAVIDKIIEDIIKKEQEKRQEEINRQQNMYLAQNNQLQNNNIQGSKWYFYNPSTIKLGASEFKTKWRDRKLEDGWRIKNKNMISADFGEDNENPSDSSQTDSAKVISSNDLKDRNTYLKQIPLTDEQLEASNNKIIEALYNAGLVYKEDLEELYKSAKYFETLIRRFPDNKFLLSTYYHLYKNYDELQEQTKANYYKNLIFSKFPDSDYAKLIKDPDNYYKQIYAKKNQKKMFYKETYLAYLNNQFQIVINNSNKADSLYKDKNLLPKFELLKALSIGQTQNIDTFKLALNSIISKYPDSNKVKIKAQSILNSIENKDKTITENDKTDSTNTKSIYQFNADNIHFYIQVVDITNVDVNELKILISDYNTKFYILKKLTINSMFLNNKQQIITVNNFENKEKAMDYFNSIKKDKTIFSKMSPKDYQHFVISVNNYSTFYKDKDVDKYLNFFNTNYLSDN